MNTTGQDAIQPALKPIPRRRLYLGIVVAWTLFGLWLAQQNVLLTISSGGRIESWWRPFAIALAGAWFWALLTPLLMWCTRRFRVRINARWQRVAAHLVLFLVVHVVDALVYLGINNLAGAQTRPFGQLLFALASYNALTYCVVVVVTMSLDYYEAYRERAVHAAQLETQLATAQFQALRAQLQPHFLFNSLNAISALMHKDVQRADRMLARLSELLRLAVDTAGTPEIRLFDEVEFSKRYLETEQMRFGDRLEVQVELPADTYDALVPTMLLQPLVENAVRHGIAPQAGPARVSIHVQRRGGNLGIVVRDTGPGLDPATAQHSTREGVGLRATRERLQKMYGPAQELVLANVSGGFETRITLPYRSVRNDHDNPVPDR